MSKRLPYYQSEPAEYLAGDIMFCSYGAQGVFTILRALYWQRDCKLTLSQAKRRINNANEFFNELINDNIIKVDNDIITINFLNEQHINITNQSTVNSENGKKGAAKRWGKNSESIAPPLIRHSESIALREDKIREDNNTYIYSEVEFLERWKKARLHYDKQPTNITKLTGFEKIAFKNICNSYTPKEIDNAIAGLFQQKTYPATRLRPSHFLELEHFEKYLTCWVTKEKLYDTKNKRPIERI